MGDAKLNPVDTSDNNFNLLEKVKRKSALLWACKTQNLTINERRVTGPTLRIFLEYRKKSIRRHSNQDIVVCVTLD